WSAVQDQDLPTGMATWCPQLSRVAVRNLEDAVETTEAGLRLYHHLKAGPAFRFARVAWEAELVHVAELFDYVTSLENGQRRFDLECAVSQDLYEELGSPSFCHPFRDGYWWTRYMGERYQPLYSSDQN